MNDLKILERVSGMCEASLSVKKAKGFDRMAFKLMKKRKSLHQEYIGRYVARLVDRHCYDVEIATQSALASLDMCLESGDLFTPEGDADDEASIKD